MADGPPQDQRMSLGNHLEELRHRVILSLIGVAVGAGAALLVGKRICSILCLPLLDALRAAGQEPALNYFSPIEGFSIYLKVSLAVGVIIASPWVIYQGWKFISVGMYSTEQRTVLLLLPFSALMTVLGILFLYFIILPICLWFFISFGSSFPPPGEESRSWMIDLVAPSRPMAPSPKASEAPGQVPVLANDHATPGNGDLWINGPQRQLCVGLDDKVYRIALDRHSSMMQPVIGASQYISFVTILAIAIAVTFQLPVVLLILGWTRLVPPPLLVRYRPHCVFGCFVVSMIITPADPISMVLLAIPLWGLFELGLVLMRMAYGRGEGGQSAT